MKDQCAEHEALDTSAVRIREDWDAPLEGAVLESVEGQPPVLRGVTLIVAGTSRNRRRYTEAVLQRDGHVFEGAPAFITNHHPQDKTLRNLAGVYENVRMEGDRLKADLRGLASDAGLLAKAAEAAQVMGPDRVGLSIDTHAKFVARREAGVTVQEVDALYRTPRTSVDIVINPAAGGRLTEAAMEDSEMRDLIARLTEAVLAQTPPATVRVICEGLTDEQIREYNPDLAPAILARRDAPEETPAPAEPETGAQETAGGVGAVDVAALVREQVEAALRPVREATLEARISEARLDPVSAELVRSRLAGRAVEASEIESEIRRVRDLAGRAHPNRPNVPGGTVQVTENFDLLRGRLEAACTREPVEVNGRRCQPFTSISQAILAFHPERMRDWVDSPADAARESLALFTWGGGTLSRHLDRVAESSDVLTTTFDQAWADVLNRVLIRNAEDPELNTWRQLVSDFISFRDLTNTYKLITRSDFGTFPDVAEDGPYQSLASQPADRQQTMSAPSKKGGLYSISWESLLMDDIRVLANIPADMGRAWAWTVYDVVYGVLQLNSGAGVTMAYDSNALYHNDHANIASSAFTVADLETARRKMPVQTDPTSGKRKNYRARYLLYSSPTLDQSIWEALQSVYKITAQAAEINLPNFIRGYLQLEPVPVIYPTATTTRWELIADPRNVPTLAVGFLGGRQQLDVFVQDQETVGTRFSADQVTYKGRGTVGATAIDHRAFVRGNA